MFRLRALNCQLSIIIRNVTQIDVEAIGMLLHPSPVLIDIGGIDDKEEIILSHFIDQQIIYCSTILVAHHTIVDLSHRCTCYVIRKDMLHIAFSIVTANNDLSHVRHIKQAYFLTYRIMLWSYSCILIE